MATTRSLIITYDNIHTLTLTQTKTTMKTFTTNRVLDGVNDLITIKLRLIRTCSCNFCNHYGIEGHKCTRCPEEVSSYYLGKILTVSEMDESDRIMEEEDNFDTDLEYTVDTLNLVTNIRRFVSN